MSTLIDPNKAARALEEALSVCSTSGMRERVILKHLQKFTEGMEKRVASDENFALRAEQHPGFVQLLAWAGQFKAFHKNLCERFGYCHDEQDWMRDLASLEEHIATKLTCKTCRGTGYLDRQVPDGSVDSEECPECHYNALRAERDQLTQKATDLTVQRDHYFTDAELLKAERDQLAGMAEHLQLNLKEAVSLLEAWGPGPGDAHFIRKVKPLLDAKLPTGAQAQLAKGGGE